jgi:hypothetical protein
MGYGLWNMIAEIEINEFIHLCINPALENVAATRFTAGKG